MLATTQSFPNGLLWLQLTVLTNKAHTSELQSSKAIRAFKALAVATVTTQHLQAHIAAASSRHSRQELSIAKTVY